MPFPESVKLDAKRGANFRCVVCHEPWVEVHHIIPEAEGGSNTLENAAPLCASCHHRFGDNPALRKQLREMRDSWWARCRQSATEPAIFRLSEKFDDLRTEYLSGQADNTKALRELKALFTENLRSTESAIDSAATIGEVLAVSSAYSTGLSATGPGQQICPRCGTPAPGDALVCPSCRLVLR